MNKILNSSAFTNVFWLRKPTPKAWDLWPGGVMELYATIPPTDRIVIVGADNEIGNWDPMHGMDLLCDKLPLWYLPLDRLNLAQNTEFKFVIMRDQKVVAWENGDNRRWESNATTKYMNLGEFRAAQEYFPRFAGVAIPLFSLVSHETEGIGDYLALGDMARWSAAAGLRAVQLLPINDTTNTHTWHDSYPYSAISVFALNPLYIRVQDVDPLSDVSALKVLNKQATLNYDQVDHEKWRLLREAYARQGATVLASEEFHEFYLHNQTWIHPYAAFSVLRDKFGTTDFALWDAPYNVFSAKLCDDILADNALEVGFYYFLQFHADRQLSLSCQVARDNGVIIKGDISIGVSRHSVDTWSNAQLFNMNSQAGAPPDAFSAEGQNWGFPTYNWTAMARENYQWWRMRLEKMADYFDMYRIDHILGFFRIWSIPITQKSAIMGHFSPALPYSAQELEELGLPMYEERYIGVDDTDQNTLFVRDSTNRRLYHPRIAAHYTQRYKTTLDNYEKERFNALYTEYFYHRNDQFWACEAIRKLSPLINATSMLCAAEDLGMIPKSVASTLATLEILTLEIERMPKEQNATFGSTASYAYNSVAATSTHDMSPIRLWWQENPQLREPYYHQVLKGDQEVPTQVDVDVCEQIIANHIASPALAVILPLQDWLSVSADKRAADPSTEQINDPSNPNHYWRYRMHINVEDLLADDTLNAHLRRLVAERTVV
ncbi:MAG: 4-alpha-glucanotransferase [Mucinivorans sp.]